MPRWAELVVVLAVGVAVTTTIMVYARFSTRESRMSTVGSVLGQAGSGTPAAAAGEGPGGAAGPSVAEADRAAARAVRRALEDRGDHVSAGRQPEMGPPLAAANLPRPPVEGAEPRPAPPSVAADLEGPPDPAGTEPGAGTADAEAGEGAEGGTEGKDEPELDPGKGEAKEVPEDEWKGASPGSVEELVLLEQAEQRLTRLHDLKLRPDVAPAASEEEAQRLRHVLDRLAPETRKRLEVLIDSGYNARQRTGDARGDLTRPGVKAGEIAEHRQGEYDDTPGDVRGLRDRISALRATHGDRAPPPPPSGGAAVNPTSLPAAPPATAPSAAPGGGLPSVAPQSL